MKLNNLFIKYVNQPHERTYGRYYASELYSIIKGYLKPQDFWKAKDIDIDGAKNILRGEAYETKLKEILEFNKVDFKYGDEIKYELPINDEIILVVKPDFELKDFVIETKFPIRDVQEIPEKWKYQCEAEYRATKKPVIVGVFNNIFDIRFIDYKPSALTWKKIQTALINFHSKVPKV
jgi:hypothetical protein